MSNNDEIQGNDSTEDIVIWWEFLIEKFPLLEYINGKDVKTMHLHYKPIRKDFKLKEVIFDIITLHSIYSEIKDPSKKIIAKIVLYDYLFRHYSFLESDKKRKDSILKKLTKLSEECQISKFPINPFEIWIKEL